MVTHAIPDLQCSSKHAYGVRQHNWPLFVIAAILLSDDARRQLRYRCKAGNESDLTPLTACACDVRLLNYAWKNADWLTMASGRDYQPISSSRGATVFLMLLSNAQCGVGTRPAVDRDHQYTLEECNRTRAVHLSSSSLSFAQCATSSCHWVTYPACSRWLV